MKGVTIRLFHTTVAGNLPPVGSLTDGELALDALSDPPHLYTAVPTTRDPSGRIDLLADGGVILPLSIADGGTGATTAGGAVTNLGGPWAPLSNPANGQNNYAPLASPNFTGTVSIGGTALGGLFAPLTNPANGQNNYLPIANPTFTGTLTGPVVRVPAPATASGGLAFTIGPSTTSPIMNISAGSNGMCGVYHGLYNNGTNYIATQAFANQITLTSGQINFFIDTGLTVGQTVTGNYAGYFTTGGLTVLRLLTVTGNGVAYPSLGAGDGVGFNWNTPNVGVWVNGGWVGNITFQPSDARLKRNIAPATEDALVSLCAVDLVKFDLINPIDRNDPVTYHHEVGVTAQQIRPFIPEAVTEGPDKEATLSIQIFPLVARCIGAIQQLAKRVEQLEART